MFIFPVGFLIKKVKLHTSSSLALHYFNTILDYIFDSLTLFHSKAPRYNLYTFGTRQSHRNIIVVIFINERIYEKENI